MQAQPVITVCVNITSEQEAFLECLDPCTSYWVTVTAVHCASRVSSEPQQIGLYQPMQFNFDIMIEDICNNWISENTTEKINDTQNEVLSTLRGQPCDIEVPCIADSQWKCSDDDTSVNPTYEYVIKFPSVSIVNNFLSMHLIYNECLSYYIRTTLVSTAHGSSQNQLRCLNDWIATVKTLRIVDQDVMVCDLYNTNYHFYKFKTFTFNDQQY